MLLKVDGTDYEIDTIVNEDGVRWVSLWKGNLLVDSSFLSVDEAVDTVTEMADEAMKRFSEAMVDQTVKTINHLLAYVRKYEGASNV